MKNLKHYLAFALPVVATVAMLFSSCSSGLKGKEAQVPNDAYFVSNINIDKMWENGDLKNIENLKCFPMIQEGLSQMPQVEKFVMGLLNDPSSSGIDTEKDVLLFGSKKDNSFMVTLTASLKDKEAFTDFLTTLGKYGEFKVSIDDDEDANDGLVYATLDKEVVAVYSEKGVALVIPTDRKGRKLMNEYAASLFSMDEDESLNADSQFQSYWNDRKEMGIFVSLRNILGDEDIARLIKSQGSEAQLKDMMGASYYATFAFENGDIKIKSKALGIPDQYNNIIGKGISNTLLNFMPDQTLAATSLSYNTKALLSYVEKDNTTRRAFNEKLGVGNYTIKDLFAAFGGNLVASFYGMRDDLPLFAVAADISNADMVRDLLVSLDMTQKGNFYQPTGKDIPGCIFFDGKTLAYTNDIEAANKYANGGYSNGLGRVADKAKKGNYFYMDLNLKNYPSAIRDMLNITEMDQILSMFNNLEVVTSTDNTATITLTFNDKKNSLNTIIRLIDEIAYHELTRPRYSYEEAVADTAMVEYVDDWD